MGRKEASNNTGLPVENYRKQIGKNQYKKTSRDAKEMKRKSEARQSSMSVQEVVLVLAAVTAILAGIYFLFYVYISADSKTRQTGQS